MSSEQLENRADRLVRVLFDARASEPTPEHLVRLADVLEDQANADKAA